MERCKHNMMVLACAHCRVQPKTAKLPVPHKGKMVHAATALDAERCRDEGFAVVHPKSGRERCGTIHLGEKTRFVHIDGAPMLWLIEQILESAPNLRTIQVIPSALRHMKPDSHLRLCNERGVQVVTGHIGHAWEGPRIITQQYEPQRQFLLSLSGDQKVLFEELRLMDFESVQMASRYFCLQDEPYVSQRILCDEFGCSAISAFSAKVASVIYYLDPTFEANERSVQLSDAMKRRVIALRPMLASAEVRAQVAKELGLSVLPKAFPLARLETFKEVLAAHRDGRFAALQHGHEGPHRALALRFGLDDLNAGVYRRLQEVGDLMGGITRERVRQLEARGLELLGIDED